MQECELPLKGPHEVQAPDFGLGVAERHLDFRRWGRYPRDGGGELAHVVGGSHEEVERGGDQASAP